MASKRELRSAGSTVVQTLDSTKNYKYNSSGALVESTPAGTEIVFSGSKSSLRRISDLERNVSILAAKALTDDGTASGYTGDVDFARAAGKWSTARTLALTGDVTGSATIDGSGNVSLSTTVGSNTVILGTDTTGNYMANVTAGAGISVSHTQGEGSTATITSTITQYTDALARAAVSFTAGSGAYNSTTGVFTIPTNNNQLTNGSGYTTNTGTVTSVAAGSYLTGGTITTSGTLAVDATNLNTASKVVARDASGNFSAGTITAALSGNATTATTAGNVSGTVAIANGGTGATTAAGALAALGAYAASNPSGYTTNTGTVTSVGATGPVVSSGGTAPVISMPAATSVANGYMTSTYAAKLDGIASGATANTGTVTGVSGTAPIVSSGGTAPAISISAATTSAAGSMSATDKAKLDGIASGATANTGTVTGVTATGPVVSSGGTAPVISMAAATSSVNGYMTSTYAAKLDGIAAGATNVTNTNQLTNGAGYITGYSETSTLASVTARGNTSNTRIITRQSGVTLGSGQSSQLEINNGASGACNIAFHREGVYGAHFGLDTDNLFSTYGWSAGTGYTGMRTGALTVTGAITATGEVTAYYSDANLKKDIVEIADPIEKLMSIRGVTFRPNETALALGITDKEEVGVIAQEVEAVLPQLVTASAFKGYKTVKYDKLTALLVEAVKAQQLQIDALRAEIAKLGGSATTEL